MEAAQKPFRLSVQTTQTAEAKLTEVAERLPTSTPLPTLIVIAPTETPIPPTDTLVPPTNTPVPKSTDTLEPTNTPQPPTSTPTPIPTNTPTPTYTPRPMPTLTAAMIDNVAIPLYDNFDDTTYNGSVNTTIWRQEFHEVCEIYQQDGVMVFKNKVASDYVNCRLVRPEPSITNKLGIVEARVKLSSDHNGKYVNSGVQFDTNENGWWAFCGLEGGIFEEDYSKTPQIAFNVQNFVAGKEADIEKKAPANYDQWYTFRIEIDPETMSFSCFVDNVFFSSIVPSDASDLRGASFKQVVTTFRTPDAFVTSYMDDVRILP